MFFLVYANIINIYIKPPAMDLDNLTVPSHNEIGIHRLVQDTLNLDCLILGASSPYRKI